MKLSKDLLTNSQIISVEAGRGCPYTCTFCSSHSIWTRKPRFKSPERLLNESQYYIDQCENRETPLLISYEHDDFLSNRKFFKKFAKDKILNKQNFIYGITTRINHLSDEIIDKLIESNCVSIFMGLETGSEEMQKACSKRLKIETVLPIIAKLRKGKVNISANFIVGFPEEKLSDVFDTFKLLLKLSWMGCTLNISMLCPEPGSDLHKDVDKSLYKVLKTSDYYNELLQGGIDPIQMDIDEKFHLLTIKNNNYDIERLEIFCSFFQILLNEFPYYLYVLWVNSNNDIESLYTKIVKKIESVSETEEISPIDVLGNDISIDNNNHSQFIAYEKLKYEKKRGLAYSKDFSYFSNHMPNSYYLFLGQITKIETDLNIN